MKKTPLAVFAYNRPEHLRKTLDALGNCRRLDDCRIFIYCDGPKTPAQNSAVEAVRAVAAAWAKKNSAKVVTSEKNIGLSVSITKRVSELCSRYGRVIVLEDDLIVSPAFVDFMLQALDRYENDEKVFQVAGFVFGEKLLTTEDSCLMPISTTWGWATWERAWKLYHRDPKAALNELKNPDFQFRFDLQGAYPYSRMLKDNIEKKNDSWGIWWWWTIFNKHGVVIYPRKSLVYNNGLDNSGVHSGKAIINQIHISDLEQFQGVTRLNYPPNTITNQKALNQYTMEINKSHLSVHEKGIEGLSFFRPLTLLNTFFRLARRVRNRLQVANIPHSDIQKKFQAQIGLHSQIFPEGKIENIFGDPARVKIGENTFIRGRLLIYGHGGEINIGDWCFVGPRSEIWSMDSIHIGDRVLISHDVNIHDGTAHSANPIERHEHFKQIIKKGHPKSWDEMPGVHSAPIIIEDDVWISFGVTILKGVRIGARSIIAAGSIVIKDVPPDSFYRSQITPMVTSIKGDNS